MASKARYRDRRRLMGADQNSAANVRRLRKVLPDAIWARVYRVDKEPFGGDYVVLMHGRKPGESSVVRVPRAIWRAGGAAAKICLEAS